MLQSQTWKMEILNWLWETFHQINSVKRARKVCFQIVHSIIYDWERKGVKQENLICRRENGDVERKGSWEARDKHCSTKNKTQSTQAGKRADKHSGNESASGIRLDISASRSEVSSLNTKPLTACIADIQ